MDLKCRFELQAQHVVGAGVNHPCLTFSLCRRALVEQVRARFEVTAESADGTSVRAKLSQVRQAVLGHTLEWPVGMASAAIVPAPMLHQTIATSLNCRGWRLKCGWWLAGQRAATLCRYSKHAVPPRHPLVARWLVVGPCTV